MSGSDGTKAIKSIKKTGSDKRNHITLFLGCLLALAVLYTLYFAQSLLMPMTLALLFSLLLSPLVNFFARYYVPRTLSAIVLLIMIGGPFALLGSELGAPAQKWAAEVPKLSMELKSKMDKLNQALVPVDTSGAKPTVSSPPPPPKKGLRFFSLFDKDEPVADTPNAPQGSVLSDRVMQGGVEVLISMLGAAPAVIAQLLIFIILLVFLLISGASLFSNFIDIFSPQHDNEQASKLVSNIQKELSRYIFTITLINFCLGTVTALIFWFLGVEDALLWGVMVGLLNFAPYIGPIFALCILTIAGLVQYDLGLAALLPAGVYFCINLLEAQFITPLALGRYMRINPLVVIVWLVIWGWLWGFVGVLLAVPLLVCLKLIAKEVEGLRYWVTFIETRN